MDDGVADPCPICLAPLDVEGFLAQPIGCVHQFCFPCLNKWVTRGNATCPNCRGSFTHIRVHKGGVELRRMPVKVMAGVVRGARTIFAETPMLRSPSLLASLVEDEDEECMICLRRVGGYGRLRLAAEAGDCGHLFCVRCIVTWVEKGNCTCPACRGTFDRIRIRRDGVGPLAGLMTARVVRAGRGVAIATTETEELEKWMEYPECVVCGDLFGKGSRVHCICCGCTFHLSCHKPKLRSIPIDHWTCSHC